ncbi:MAG: 2Fe-2S iron-sulfur cluster-binding protein, partial [Acidimicrobiales bacterium]
MTTETKQIVNVTIDGRQIAAGSNELIIDVAERNGVYIPRFCYHPRMAPVGMCRMCLVEVSGPRGFSLQPACFFTAQDGQEIRTDTEKARKAQVGVLEFLLVNHPLDCPVCDKGGECPLQDQALSYGPGESRYLEEKRHFAKPIEIGPLVLLDRERCIQCARCTRFSEEIAGDAMINLAFRADVVEVATFPDSPFRSYFAGNTIQICPVGALTSPAYRFRSRPWDLEQVETTCTSCAVGCRIAAQSSAGQIVRHLGIDSDPVNQSWLCDKGRYGFEAVHSENRFSEPLVHRDDAFVPTTWRVALDEVATNLRETIERSGPESIAAIGGARLSNEDAYVWARLLKSVVRTDSVDAQVGDGIPAHAVVGLPHATIDAATRARVLVTLTGDLREELPILFLRLKLAAEHGLRIIECTPAPTPLSQYAEE